MALITRHTDTELNTQEIEEQFGYEMSEIVAVTHNPCNNYAVITYRDGSTFVDLNDVTEMREVPNFANGLEIITE